MAKRLNAGRLEQRLKALGSHTRLEIMQLLANAQCVPGEAVPGTDTRARCAPGEICLTTLAETLGMTPPTVSRHMAVLKDAGLVSARRSGQWTGFSIRRGALESLAGQITVLKELGERTPGRGCE